MSQSSRSSRLATNLMLQTRRKAQVVPPGTIRLDHGDPYFNTPEPIRRALSDAVDAGVVHYADPEGDPLLRKHVADRVSERSGRWHEQQQVTITHGATGGLAAAILGTVDPGDGVIIPEPSYSLYADLVRMAGGQPLFCASRSPEFRVDTRALAALATRAKLVVLCHPCNPTGTVYTRDELEEIARIAEDHDLIVLSDEAYDHIVYEPDVFTSALDIARLAGRLLYVQTFSKTYAMTGWRVGYLVAPPDVAPACAWIHRTLVGPVNSAVQRAASVALAHRDEWHREMLERYRRRRDLVVDALGAVSASRPLPPQGTFYMFARHPRGVTSEAMAELALKEGVAVRPGSEYGPSGEGFVRIAYSLSVDDVTEGMIRLSRAFQRTSGHQVKRGSNASRTAFPNMLADNTASTIATPGHSTSQMEWNI
jgi:aspartate aminotransferase